MFNMLIQINQSEETDVRPRRIDLWILKHTKKNGIPLDLASGEAMVWFCYIIQLLYKYWIINALSILVSYKFSYYNHNYNYWIT